MNAGSCHSNLAAPPENFPAYTLSLRTLRLRVSRLQEWPWVFLAHSPQLKRLELKYWHGNSGKEIYSLRSVPARFLADALNLTISTQERFAARRNCQQDSRPIRRSWNV